MPTVDTVRRLSLERWAPTLFLAGGLSLLVYTTFNAVAASTGTVYPAAENSFGPGGFVLGFLGLLGLYPRLVDGSPWLARAGAGAAALGAAGFGVITATTLGRVAGLVPAEPPAWFPVLLLLVAVGMVPGYLAVAAATLRTGGARTLGLLLLAPALVFATMATQATLFTEFGLLSERYLAWSAVAISGSQAFAHLAIGRTLRARRTAHERPTASDAAAG